MNEANLIQASIEQLERVSRSMASIGETEDYTEVAINALEKQIPKKPDFTEDKEFALCPCCNGNGLADKQEYCDNCGPKLDWSGVMKNE